MKPTLTLLTALLLAPLAALHAADFLLVAKDTSLQQTFHTLLESRGFTSLLSITFQ